MSNEKTQTPLKADRAEIDRACALLFEAGQVVEVRILKTRFGTVSGYFNNFQLLADAIQQADAKYHAGGVYYVLNPADPALLGRAFNRLKEYAELTTADGNIQRRRWLPVDLDPVRPSGISSSDAEHDFAIVRAHIIAKEMAATWGQPTVADSGNGSHLLYRIDLPNDEKSLRSVSGMLAMLDKKYSDEHVKIDLTSANAARIWKAYGTVARKGDSFSSRPHRLSKILAVPE